MFRVIFIRPIFAIVTWFVHHRSSKLYDQEHANVYGREHSPDSLYSIMARKILDTLSHHIELDKCVALDAGCGSGGMAEKLLDSGARKVYLFDRSAEMLSRAANRLTRFGDRAVMWQANIENPIHLESNTVDCILCIQVLHYIENWDSIAAELFRVMRDGGCAIIVSAHPAADTVHRGIGNYFKLDKRKAFLSSGGKLWPFTYWNRSLEAMFAPFLSAGFFIIDVAEPYLQSPKSRPWWDIAESLFQYFPPYIVYVLRKGQ